MKIKWFLILLPFIFGMISPLAVFPLVIDQILAVVNQEVITASDLRTAEIIQIREHPSSREKLLEQLIDETLLVKEAERFEIKAPSEEEVLTAYLSLKEKISTHETFQEFLQNRGTTSEILKEAFQRQIWISRFLRQRIDFFVLVLPEEVTRYYRSHTEEFSSNEMDENDQKWIEEKLIKQKAEQRRKEYISKLRGNAEIRMNAIFP